MKKSNRAIEVAHKFSIALAGAAILLCSSAAIADPPYAMAPPVASSDQDYSSTAPDSVFNWTDVPRNQRVQVDHASFDEGGYQIFDSAGETIVVPFKDQNLYVMKFARSSDDTMYFINRGDAPVLYIPDGGYLQNATVSGARWYPFPRDYQPSGAVYVGPAPSWDVFVGMGWYSGMRYYGGYYCDRPVWDGGLVVAFPGLFFEIGGRHYDGWDSYHDYYERHPGWYRPEYHDRNIYHWAGRPSISRPPFGSVDHHGSWYGDHNGGGDHNFGGDHNGGGHNFGGDHNGGGHNFGGDHNGSGDHNFGGDHGFTGGDHHGDNGNNSGFHGTGGSNGGYHTFHGTDGGNDPFGGSHQFHGSDTHTFNGGDHNFGGGDNHSGGDSGSHTYNGGDNHTFHGSSDSHTFGGDNHNSSGGDSHSFHGSDSHSSGGDNHSSGGDNHSSRGDSRGGGDRSSRHDDH